MIRLAACAFALVLLGAPLGAQPQPGGKVPRIGWLTSSTIHEPNVTAFREGMRILGYAEVSIEFRAAAGHADRLPTFASELARLKLDVILVDGGAAAIAAKRAISDVPVVVGAMGGGPRA